MFSEENPKCSDKLCIPALFHCQNYAVVCELVSQHTGRFQFMHCMAGVINQSGIKSFILLWGSPVHEVFFPGVFQRKVM